MPPITTESITEFWDSTLQRAREQPLASKVEKLDWKVPYEAYRVEYRSLGGVPIVAMLGVPICGERPGRKFPVIVSGPGYGGREFGGELGDCMRGYLVLQVYPRGQGESGKLWHPGEAYEGAWVNYGKKSREGFFYQGALADMVRGVDYVLTRPDADAQRVGLMGTSQGGYLVLATAGIDERVRAVVSHVPYLCDVKNNAAFAGSLARDAELMTTWESFEPVNLAPRIQAATLVSTGGRDKTCPAESIRAVFDRLPGIKALAHYPELTHTTCVDFYRMGWEWMERHL
jgi:cephalosporin-C deacetylase